MVEMLGGRLYTGDAEGGVQYVGDDWGYHLEMMGGLRAVGRTD